jgi:hypothetical protein
VILRALTLWRPWSAAIVHGPKRCENRSWARRDELPPGSLLAIHSGSQWAPQEDIDAISALWPGLDPDPHAHPKGAVLGVAEVVRYDRIHRDPIPADPWACGPWVWRLGRVVPLLVHLRMPGRYGLWRLPADLEANLIDAWRSAA